MSNKEIVFSNCNSCPCEFVCCSTDSWTVNLTAEEAKRFPHTRLPNGQFTLSSGSNGYCIYFDEETKKCKTYNDRPNVCLKFTCKNREEEMNKLLEKHKEIRKNLDAKYSGFFVAFVFKTERQKMASSLVIRDIETGKEIQIMPTQVYGNTEDEVKENIAKILKMPFNKENL